jgi:hypothetical protein
MARFPREMDRWTHAICDACWEKQRLLPLDRQLSLCVRLPRSVRIARRRPMPMPCCYCGEAAWSGRFVNQDPDEARCNGRHKR